MITIPDEVLAKIVAHRPHLAGLVKNLRWLPARAGTIEKTIASNYLSGETRLSGPEMLGLSRCCVGLRYDGGKRIVVASAAHKMFASRAASRLACRKAGIQFNE